MPSYSKEFKESVTAKLLNEKKPNYVRMSEETGLHENTLRRWRQSAEKKGMKAGKAYYNKQALSSEDKFIIAAKTMEMSENELSEYCRGKGLYVEEVREWKLACMSVNGRVAENNSKLNAELKEAESRERKLQKELSRKEKALAETAALLVMSKKLEAFWESSEKED